MAFYRLVTALVLILNIGGSLEAEVRSSIIGGHDAPKGKWPWMAHLNITSDGKDRWRCGGTIVSDQWVLTAANCLDLQRSPNWRRSMVWVGSHSLQKESARYMGIENIIIDYGFRAQGSGYVNDIALVKLKKKLIFSQNVAPVTLPSIDDTFGSSSECWITGWGNIGTNGNQDGGMDACKGDYGGPLVCRKGGDYVQVGVMSYGSCGLSGRPGVYTQVSKYLRFINYYIKKDSAEV
ncbi:Tryptase-2 [Nibea albiflora]|uniref:Tryptase-2 n=1 Tax=Nibea albiflora TaxID=240163 RepID=A0ACB7EXX8_NIBAL|nr:Tryptase-2 [Nibea albiflora]